MSISIDKFKSLIIWSNNEKGDRLIQKGDLEHFLWILSG